MFHRGGIAQISGERENERGDRGRKANVDREHAVELKRVNKSPKRIIKDGVWILAVEGTWPVPESAANREETPPRPPITGQEGQDQRGDDDGRNVLFHDGS